ncbi:hypothetical protein HC928_02350 [bacterium]|nr:hypothetical protein [bacterium]
MPKFEALTEAEARARLAAYTHNIVLIVWAGNVTSPSLFKNLILDIEFSRDFAGVIKSLKQGKIYLKLDAVAVTHTLSKVLLGADSTRHF